MSLWQRRRVRRIGTFAGLAVALFALVPPSTAAANTITSHNWSGYAVHRSGVEFRTVVASWRQPAGSCTPGNRSYSAFWVGIGGYSLTARALEQIGTELDCENDGTESI
jgi:hypothetical protein